jgi:hypothetical protein
MGMGVSQGTLTMRGKRGLGDDGSEGIKRHSWFKGVDWESKSLSSVITILLNKLGSNPKAFIEGIEDRAHPPNLSDSIVVPEPYLRGQYELTSDLHRQTPPYRPELASDDDTRYFDQDIPDEVSPSTIP